MFVGNFSLLPTVTSPIVLKLELTLFDTVTTSGSGGSTGDYIQIAVDSETLVVTPVV